MTAAPARNPRVAPLRILVVGGIGGLAAAIAILRDGHDVTRVEQAKELAAVGHGITLWSNATLASPLLGRVRNACMAATPDSWMRRAFSGNLRFER